MALSNHVIRRDKVSNEDLCQLKCYLEPNCVSYNFGPSGDGVFVCELSDRSHQGVSSTDLRIRDGFTYSTITVSEVNEWTVNPNLLARISSRVSAWASLWKEERALACRQ